MVDKTNVDVIAAKVRVIVPQLTKVNDEAIKSFATDACLQAKIDGFSEPLLSLAAGYLAAHFAFVANNQNNNVAKEKADVLERSYFDRGGSDDYIIEYNRLKTTLSGGSNAVVTFM